MRWPETQIGRTNATASPKGTPCRLGETPCRSSSASSGVAAGRRERGGGGGKNRKREERIWPPAKPRTRSMRLDFCSMTRKRNASTWLTREDPGYVLTRPDGQAHPHRGLRERRWRTSWRLRCPMYMARRRRSAKPFAGASQRNGAFWPTSFGRKRMPSSRKRGTML